MNRTTQGQGSLQLMRQCAHGTGATTVTSRRRQTHLLTALSVLMGTIGGLVTACSSDEDGSVIASGATGGTAGSQPTQVGGANSGGQSGHAGAAGVAGVAEGPSQNEDQFEVPGEPKALGYIDSAPAPEGVLAYVDSGATNQRGKACMATVETNAGVRVVSGFLKIWAPRKASDGIVYVDAGVTAAADGDCKAVSTSDWNGIPGGDTDGTVLMESVHQANLNYVIQVTQNRTAAQELSAYLDDRRGKNYSISDGMGPLTQAWRTGSKQTTSITSIPADASSVKYDDTGNNRGLDSTTNADMGQAVNLLNADSTDGSTEPAKRYFKYARPYRWTSDVIVAPSLVSAESSAPTTDGGFISGHTAEAWRDALTMAYLVPQRFQEMITRASELGDNRILAGMHSPLDVIGGRVQALAVVAYNLYKTDNASLTTSAYAQVQSWLMQQTNSKNFDELKDYAHSFGTISDRFADWQTNRAAFHQRMTYGFAPIGSILEPASVPKGAEVLLATRFPCLTAEQRRVVLKTTAWASGYPVMDDAEGWGRIDLFTAADGYGDFHGDVTLTLDASKGGFCASDVFKNDITGTGRLTKEGTGALWLSGDNSYSGGTILHGGTLGALSPTAFGTGDVYVKDGTLSNTSLVNLVLPGAYTQVGGVLSLTINDSLQGGLSVWGTTTLAGGTLKLVFAGERPSTGTVIEVLKANKLQGRFDAVQVDGLTQFDVIYTKTGISVKLGAS